MESVRLELIFCTELHRSVQKVLRASADSGAVDFLHCRSLCAWFSKKKKNCCFLRRNFFPKEQASVLTGRKLEVISLQIDMYDEIQCAHPALKDAHMH